MKASVLLPAFLLVSSGLCAGDAFPPRGGESPDERDVRTDKKLQALHQEDERASEDLIDRIAQLRKEAIRAKREGDADRAKEVWSEADRLENELQGRMGGDRGKRKGRGDRDDPKMEELLRDIKEKSRAMSQEGKAKAKELANKAKELSARAKDLAKEGQPEKAEEVKREAEEMRAKGEALAREYQEKAEKLRREAEERVEKRFRAEGAPEKRRLEAFNAKPPAPARVKSPTILPPQPPGVPVPPTGLNGEAREDLRQEIDRLRSEVRELRELLKRSLEEKPRGPAKEKGLPPDQPKQSF